MTIANHEHVQCALLVAQKGVSKLKEEIPNDGNKRKAKARERA